MNTCNFFVYRLFVGGFYCYRIFTQFVVGGEYARDKNIRHGSSEMQSNFSGGRRGGKS